MKETASTAAECRLKRAGSWTAPTVTHSIWQLSLAGLSSSPGRLGAGHAGNDPSCREIVAADARTRAARYIDKILRGARPRDMPFEQPTRVRVDANVKTARALGLTLPKALVARADQVIEQ